MVVFGGFSRERLAACMGNKKKEKEGCNAPQAIERGQTRGGFLGQREHARNFISLAEREQFF